MFRSSRIARLGRVAALVAGILAVGGSFGLHPEPAASAPATTHPEWSVSGAGAEAAPHVCLACLAHRSIPLPRLTSVVFTPRPVVRIAPSTETSPVARLESRSREGRAPPSLG
jgi:hypothetical protein